MLLSKLMSLGEELQELLDLGLDAGDAKAVTSRSTRATPTLFMRVATAAALLG